eukprot:UN02251
MDLFADNATIEGNMIHLVFESILWHYIFKFLTYSVKQKFAKTAAYQRAITTSITEAEFLVYCCAGVQHSCTVIFVLYGFYSNSLFFIREGVLMEAAYDINDSLTLILNKFVYKANDLPNFIFLSLIFHHVSILTLLIPTNMYSHHIGVQYMIISVSIWTPIMVALALYCHTLDVYDLKQRGLFTVLYFTQFLIFLYFRFYHAPYYFVRMMDDHYDEWDKYSQIMIPSGMILNTVFNAFWLKVMGRRLYDFLFSDKYIKNEAKKSR